MQLSPKKQKLCDEYLKDFNTTQAAIRAGYSSRTAYSQGQRLLKNVEIHHFINEQLKQLNKATEITYEWKLQQLKRIVDISLQACNEKEGKLRAAGLRMAISAIAELNKMQGHHAANKLTVNAGTRTHEEWLELMEKADGTLD